VVLFAARFGEHDGPYGKAVVDCAAKLNNGDFSGAFGTLQDYANWRTKGAAIRIVIPGLSLAGIVAGITAAACGAERPCDKLVGLLATAFVYNVPK
jgi:hypothetical protein